MLREVFYLELFFHWHWIDQSQSNAQMELTIRHKQISKNDSSEFPSSRLSTK